MISVLMLAMFGTIILLPIYLSQILGLRHARHRPAADAGRAADGPARSVRRPALRQASARRPLIVPAMVVVSVVLWAMTLLGVDTPGGPTSSPATS